MKNCLQRSRDCSVVGNHSIGASIPLAMWGKLHDSIFVYIDTRVLNSISALALHRWEAFGAFYCLTLNIITTAVSYVDCFGGDSCSNCSYVDNLISRQSSDYGRLHQLGEILFRPNNESCCSDDSCHFNSAVGSEPMKIASETPSAIADKNADTGEDGHHECHTGCSHSHSHEDDHFGEKKFRLPAFFRPLSASFSGISINELRKKNIWPLKSYKNQM